MRCSDEVCFDSVGAGGFRLLWERRSCGVFGGRCSVARAFPETAGMRRTLVLGSDERRCGGVLPSRDLGP